MYLFFCIKDLPFLVTWPPQFLLFEVGIIQIFRNLHTREINFGVCRNDKLLVSSAQWDSIQG